MAQIFLLSTTLLLFVNISFKWVCDQMTGHLIITFD